MRGKRPLRPGGILDREHRVSYPEPPEQPANEVARGIVGLDEAHDVIALFRERQQRL